jgi:holliday junction DNA helicase RuvA
MVEGQRIRGGGERALEADGGQNLRHAHASRLLTRFTRDPEPAFSSFDGGVEKAFFGARGRYRNDALHAQFGGLFDDPFEAVEFNNRSKQGDGDRGRGRGEGFENAKGDAFAARLRNFGQIGGVVIGDFVELSGFDAEHARQVAGLLAAEFGDSIAQVIYKEAPACHCLLKSRLLKYKQMIALLRGVLLEKHPNQAVVEAGGVGYDVTIPVSTYTHLPETGSEVRLRIHTHVREDVLALYGFLTQDEKALFEKLIGVSGIGPTLAVKVLSGVTAVDLVNAIRRSELERLVRIPGVGKKTAERMVVELRDKLPAVTGEEPAAPTAETLSPVEQDVLSALLNLGCARPQAEAAVRKSKAAGVPADFEPLFRRALELVR